MRETFPPDHPIAILRGRRRRKPSDVRRALTKRCAWLEGKIAHHLERGATPATNMLIDELAAYQEVLLYYAVPA